MTQATVSEQQGKLAIIDAMAHAATDIKLSHD
jgi:hypothetical protein